MINVKEDMTDWIMSEHGVPKSRWVVLERADDKIYSNGKSKPAWICKCSCGTSDPTIVLQDSLRNGRTLSCGCLTRENVGKAHKKYNEFDLSGDYGIGYTLKNEPFWFDKEDYDKIKNYTWHYDTGGYVVTTSYNPKKHKISLHRLVMNASDIDIVDHIKHLPRQEHKIDNRKSNLRFVTQQQNILNSCTQRNNTSGYTGVIYIKGIKKWQARIDINGKRKSLGCYYDINDAIEARKLAEIKYFKEYLYKKE